MSADDRRAGVWNPERIDLVPRVTGFQRQVYFQATDLVMVDLHPTLGNGSTRAQAVELICMDYVPGWPLGPGRRAPLEPEGAPRTALHIRLFPEQLELVMRALCFARVVTGVEDNAAALTEIMLGFISEQGARDFANSPEAGKQFNRDRAQRYAQYRNGRGAILSAEYEGRGLPAKAAGGRSMAGTPHPREGRPPVAPEAAGPTASALPICPTAIEPRRRVDQPASPVSGALTGQLGCSTDLGTGVERGSLPEGDSALGSIEAFTEALGYPESELRHYVEAPRSHYSRRTKRKRKSGRRVYWAPDDDLKAIQRALLDLLRPLIRRSPFSTPSPEVAAAMHAGAPLFVKSDTRECFDSIQVSRVETLLQSLGADPEVRSLIAALTTIDGHLVQGGPTSPLLAEAVVLPADLNAEKLALSAGVVVTRWIDDVAFSGADYESLESVVCEHSAAVESLGLQIHRSATIPLGVKRSFLGFRLDRGVSLPRNYRRKVERQIRDGCLHGLTNAEQASLQGKLGRISHFHPDRVQRLRSILRKAPIRE